MKQVSMCSTKLSETHTPEKSFLPIWKRGNGLRKRKKKEKKLFFNFSFHLVQIFFSPVARAQKKRKEKRGEG
jgi:hypothetical protein